MNSDSNSVLSVANRSISEDVNSTQIQPPANVPTNAKGTTNKTAGVTLNSDRKASTRMDALEEAKSVLQAVSSGSSSGARDKKISLSPAINSESASANGIAENDEKDSSQSPVDTATAAPPPPASESPNKSTPRSRSDAVAAAKRRAEERKRAASGGVASKGSNDSKHHSFPSPVGISLKNSTKAVTAESSPTSSNQLDWFNLLGVVANPGYESWHGNPSNVASTASSSYHSRSRHGGRSRHGLSSHGTPISLDHVGSDGTRGVGPGGDTYAASFLAAAGLPEWAGYANTTSASATATLSNMATSLDEFTGWFDHYSRKYLGTVPGIDGGSLLGEGDIDGNEIGGAGGIVGGIGVGSGMSSAMWEEYEPEFGPDDVPELQLEELPSDIANPDLGSVERFLRVCGMLGMRFEDRGGGFHAMRNKRQHNKHHLGETNDQFNNEECDASTSEGKITDAGLAQAVASVPEIFFSPYFDLTDPICFENLLVVSDDEVAQIRAKEAELHALADQKVREAEEVAKRDAENETTAPRPPPRHELVTLGPEGMGSLPTQSGTSLTKEAKASSRPTDRNTVITLRKPETFTAHLDVIELALLDQVKSKSDRFFRETNRFSELQKLVTESVDEVKVLRNEMQSLRERCVTNVEIVPIMDDTRRDLRAISSLLEGVEDIVHCKNSISDLISAGDHLGAVEAIRLARSLLSGTSGDRLVTQPFDRERGSSIPNGFEHSNDECYNANTSLNPHLQERFCLSKLRAFSKVGEQLEEYEKLVVRNLTDELVETFLSWGTEKGSHGDDGGSSSIAGFDYRSTPQIALSTERRSKVLGVLESLRLCGQLSGAGVAYQKKLCELISVTVKAIVTECVADAAGSSGGTGNDANAPAKGTMTGVATMSLDQFFDCINMLFEQILGLLWGAVAVNKFCIDEGIFLPDAGSSKENGFSPINEMGFEGESSHLAPSATAAALAAGADLSEKSVSELLRLRKEAHSLVSFDGMRQLWDNSLTFTLQLEKFSGRKAYGLRSTLLAQAKSFVERKHEANMSTLVAALDSERWVQCNVSAERQATLTRLCSGRAAFSSRKAGPNNVDSNTLSAIPATLSGRDKMTDAEVEGSRYKVVWSCLLLLEMVMDDVACAAHFQTLATNVVGKISELLRLFNSRSTYLVLGAGAIHSAARLKSINAKHLAIVTQCIALVLAILPHIRAALMAQLPAKQHSLLNDLDKIKGDYSEHSEKILSKLVSIIGGIVEHSLAPKISQTDFDARAKNAIKLESTVDCCSFLESVITNTKKMHQVLNLMLPADLLQDVFSRIFAYLDHKVPSLFKNAVNLGKQHASTPLFSMPCTNEGKIRMIKEVELMAKTLNSLSGVHPWNFTAPKVLEQELDIRIKPPASDGVFDSSSETKSDEKKDVDGEDIVPVGSSDSTCRQIESSSENDLFVSEPGDSKSHRSESENVNPIPDMNDSSAFTEQPETESVGSNDGKSSRSSNDDGSGTEDGRCTLPESS